MEHLKCWWRLRWLKLESTCRKRLSWYDRGGALWPCAVASVARDGSDAARHIAVLLIASAGADSEALKRLEILARTTSGAEVAREDLRLRGPGDLLGARQTGACRCALPSLIRDAVG